MVVELDLLKGIPGYSMILKAVLKTQIQLLVSIIYWRLIIGYSTVFCKIRDFICTSLRSTEIVLDER